MQTLLTKTNAYTLLQRETLDGKNSHAYLLLFDDARNLRETLKYFAKVLLSCENEQTEDELRVSRLIDAESFSDCLFYPETGKKLSVEDADSIKEECLLRPVEGKRKIIVICGFETANAPTQNKLLKLLEEPPEGVVFLLGAINDFNILTTVRSRTKKMEILSFEAQEIEACLARIYGEKYDRETISLCAAASNGSLGAAQNILEGGYFKALMENAFALTLCTRPSLPSILKQIGETKHAKELFSLLRLIYRDALVLKTQGGKARRSLLLKKNEILDVSQKYSEHALLFAQECISKAELELTFNANLPQCLELCIAKILRENKE